MQVTVKVTFKVLVTVIEAHLAHVRFLPTTTVGQHAAATTRTSVTLQKIDVL